MLTDGLVVVVKRSCPTCQLVMPVLDELAAGPEPVAVYSQDDPTFPDGALDDARRLLEIDTAPILNVHVVYDRKVLDKPFFAALGTPVQWVFDRTHASGLREGQYLALSRNERAVS